MLEELQREFYERMIVFAAVEALPLNVPNIDFDPPTYPAAHYLRASVLPSSPSVLTIEAGATLHIWTMQVSIYAREGIGEISSLQYASKLRCAFPVATIFTGADHNYKVISAPSPAPPVLLNDGWLSTPVSFRVQAVLN